MTPAVARSRVALALGLVLALGVGCGGKGGEGEKSPEQRLREAERALDEGQAAVAMGTLGDAEGPGFALLRVRALLALKRWGEAERQLERATGPDVPAMRCELASARSDVNAERLCQEALAAAPKDVRLVVAMANALGRMHRPDEAEKLLRDAVQQSGAAAARDALISHLERFSWVREAVAEAEAWYTLEPERPGLRPRLVGLLERKVRGDLFAKRPAEALVAARRVLELAPERAQMRYYLADALAATGDEAAAAAERATAKAAGVEPPPPPSGVPGGLPR